MTSVVKNGTANITRQWVARYDFKGLSDRKDLVDLEKLIQGVPKSTSVERSFQNYYILRDNSERFSTNLMDSFGLFFPLPKVTMEV